MAAIGRDEQMKALEEKLRKMPDVSSVIEAAEAGSIGESGASVASAMTADFLTENDERAREAKATAQMLKLIARYFSLRHDDVLNEFAGCDDEHAEQAFLDIDDMRVEIINKMWRFHEMVVKRLFPSNTHEDVHGRRAAGNNVNVIIKRFLFTRRACLSPETKDDPAYAPAPPTKSDFVKQRKRTSVSAIADAAINAVSSIVSPRKAKQDAKNKLITNKKQNQQQPQIHEQKPSPPQPNPALHQHQSPTNNQTFPN